MQRKVPWLLLGVFIALASALSVHAQDGFDPATVPLTLDAGQTATVKKTLHLDALPGAADIIIAIDTTGSMGPAINQAKMQATQLCNDVQAQIPGARFAVIDFRDIPDRPATNGVNILTPVFTSLCSVVQTAIDTMTAGGGGDLAEAYNPVFRAAHADPTLDASRNPDAVQFLVVLGDAPPHNSPPAAVAPACGDQPPADPGMTSDTEITSLSANDITLLMISYGGFLSCYQQLSAPTGGTAVPAGGDLSDDIISQIQQAAAQIDEVVLNVSCSPAGPTITFNPPNPPPYGPFTAPVDISFTETITAPTTPGNYTCTVTAVVDDTVRARQTVNLTVTPGDPATLELEPATATNVVDQQHCVTATVEDAFGNPTPGITVRFSVSPTTFRTPPSGSDTTDAAGEAEFCYTSALPGSDTITAFADTDNDATQDATEPSDTARKTWTVPASTEGCKITDGGRITAANGDKANFGANAQAPTKGQQEYQDKGPATDINVHSTTITSVVCSRDGKSGSVFGTATINGTGSFVFRVDVKDLGEPSTNDTYRIRLSSGYDSGEKKLEGGNIQIH